MLVHVARARTAAHGAAAIALARTDPDETRAGAARRRSLQDIALVSGAAAKVAMDQSVQQTRLEKKARRRRASGAEEEDPEHRSSAQPVFEQLERSSERVLRAELAAARQIAAGKKAFAASARARLRECVEDVGAALLPEDADAKREREEQLLDSRPQILDALLSGDTKEIDAAFEVLTGPLILSARRAGRLAPSVLRRDDPAGIFRGGESREDDDRSCGHLPWRRVAATPRRRRGYSVEASRGDAT